MENNIIHERIKILNEKIDSLLLKNNRSRFDLSLMVVTKNATYDQILETRKAGMNLFGENYIKDSQQKIPLLQNSGLFHPESFHFIGHLQSNKVKKAISLFSTIDSIDSISLAKEIAKNTSNKQIPYPVMLEIKTSTDVSKFGFLPDNILDEFGEILLLKEINVVGLMTIGTLSGTTKDTINCFQTLRNTKNKLENMYHIKVPILSMGMSDDFSIAIEEGSNMLRIGTAIFGGL